MQTGELDFCHDWAAGSIDCDVGLSSVQLIIFSMVGEAVQLKSPCLAAMWSSTTRRRCLRPSFSLSQRRYFRKMQYVVGYIEFVSAQ